MATLTIHFTPDTNHKLGDYHGLAYTMRDLASRAKNVDGLTVGYAGGEDYPTTLTFIGEAGQVNQLFRYFYKDDDAVISAASNLEFQQYRAGIVSTANDIKRRIAAGEFDACDDDDLTEAIESAGEVIMYSEAALTLRHSQNENAYFEEMGRDAESNEGDECVRASFAQAADIREELGDLEELFDQTAPLTDEEKGEAVEYVNNEVAGRPDEPYTRADVSDLFLDAAGEVRTSSEGQEKVIEYLGETVLVPTID